MKQFRKYATPIVFIFLLSCLRASAIDSNSTDGNTTLAARKKLGIVQPVTSCESLTQVNLTKIGGKGSSVTEAVETTRNGVEVCSVKGRLAPTITFQMILPMTTWTQRYLQVGCGGLCGSIRFNSEASDGCKTLADNGFVMAATDMGHSMRDGDSWAKDPQKRADFAHRAQHVTSLAARKLIKKFYGQAEKYSYFNGCSDGGRAALMQAQRYPRDFDGVIAGAPAMLFQVQNTLFHGWQARANTDENNKGILLSAKLPILHQAVLDECDALDGVKDGLISNPAACKFDPETIKCSKSASNTSECLTASEVEVVRKFYEGPQDPETRRHLTAGQPLYGSELEWNGVFVGESAEDSFMSSFIIKPVLQHLAFANATSTLEDLEFTNQTLAALRDRHRLFDATNTKLQAFASTGHKLILWHGLADPHISPSNTVAYYNALLRDMGSTQVNNFARLYLIPGMSHCSGGDGPGTLNLLTAMMTWVEEGRAPNAILASNERKPSSFGPADRENGPGLPSGAPDDLPPWLRGESRDDLPPWLSGNRGDPEGLSPFRPRGRGGPGGPRGPGGPGGRSRASTLPNMTRPIYPYPYTSQYVGKGDIYDAANWRQGPKIEYVPTRDWHGADLFGRYEFINQ